MHPPPSLLGHQDQPLRPEVEGRPLQRLVQLERRQPGIGQHAADFGDGEDPVAGEAGLALPLVDDGVVGVQELPKKFRHVDEGDEDLIIPESAKEGMPTIANMGSTALLPVNGIDLKEYLTNLERSLIQQALDDSVGVVARAAEKLQIRRTTLVEKMRKYDLQRK